ncbi:holin family protein [Aliiroseovarius marinus]|uniref:holin family protein n=1 Tax=Aliiroseovarius marinus TaxID=2500159 RepID=UPI00105F312C|nr:holin family protein [Aliiroseovarius marinus]
MGLIGDVIRVLFGGRGNVVRETAEVFRENAEAASARDAELQMAAIEAFAAEFAHARRGRFDRFMDALNRLPRPALALSTLGLFAAAMVDPVWFADRMLGITLVPEPLWWLMGAIVSFYFGARQQVKGQEFQRSIAEVLVRANELRASADPQEVEPLAAGFAPLGIRPLSATVPANVDVSDNAALKDWKAQQNGK